MELPLWISQFHFIRPLMLLLLVPLAWLIYLRWQEASESDISANLPAHLRDALTINEQGWRKQLPLKLLTLIVILGVVITAGPTWQREASPFGEDKAAMVIVLDNSDSMLETDLAPSRIERVKHKIEELLELKSGGKNSLVVFAGSAHTAMPATQDSAVFTPFLAAIEPSIMPRKGKLAQTALPLIDQQLDNVAGSSVLFISDGISPEALSEYEQFFAQRPYQLVILAAGNEDVVSQRPVDIDSLKALASATNGKLIEVTVDNRDVHKLNSAIEKQMQLTGESAMPWQDMGYMLLFPSCILLLFWFRKGWLVQWCFVGALLLPSMTPIDVMAASTYYRAEQEVVVKEVTTFDKAYQFWLDLWLTPDQQAQRLFEQGDYLGAAKKYTDPMQKGKAYYYGAEYTIAHSYFIQVDSQLGQFYTASALSRQREYLAARKMLSDLLAQDTLDAALKVKVANNFKILDDLIGEINRFSKSQKSNQEVTSFELAEEDAQTAEGADEEVFEEQVLKQKIGAADLMQDPQMVEQWFKRVQADPSRFLASKFQLQLRAQNAGK
ncbi:vWA domain-containing protein [Thalassotalea sp. PLHSN55]|uniref:vWA domain-containing protein n=1 Tax=Thalassotalea sp. PLHSN55 TaxID=3435888 RepID=UPI003F82A6CA